MSVIAAEMRLAISSPAALGDAIEAAASVISASLGDVIGRLQRGQRGRGWRRQSLSVR